MVYTLLADGVEEIEAVYPIDVLRRCGVSVTTVGVTGKTVTGSNKITIQSDIGIDELNPGDSIAMLIIPGGPGRVNLKANAKAIELIKRCFDNDIPVAAICGAPEILGELGHLKGRKATCYPGLESNLTGAEYVDAPVVIDGNLITSQGAGTSQPFAFAIAEHLCGKVKADEVYKKMVCS